jgi:positive regulator of sigma E activity
MIKMKPKSCSCSQCKRGKHGGAKDIMRYDERKARHAAKIALAKGEEVVIGIPVGNYYD